MPKRNLMEAEKSQTKLERKINTFNKKSTYKLQLIYGVFRFKGYQYRDFLRLCKIAKIKPQSLIVVFEDGDYLEIEYTDKHWDLIEMK